MKEYTVKQLAVLAGISTRTIRHYDNMGLLKPAYINDSGYRVYQKAQVDQLQQILLYKQMGFALKEIKSLLRAKDFDRMQALQVQSDFLHKEHQRIKTIIKTVANTIAELKGEKKMTDSEKFKGLKEQLIAENEQKYGEEIREKYGEASVKQSTEKFMGLSEQEYNRTQALAQEILDTIHHAMEKSEGPGGAMAQKACALHKEWLLYFWPEYTKEAHANLGEMYVADPRFTAYYDTQVPGTAKFLRDALLVFTK